MMFISRPPFNFSAEVQNGGVGLPRNEVTATPIFPVTHTHSPHLSELHSISLAGSPSGTTEPYLVS